AGFPQKIAWPQNGNDRLFPCGGGCGKLYTTRLNVKDIINWLALGEEDLPLTEFDVSLRYATGSEKAKYLGGSSSFDFRASGCELRASGFGASSFDSLRHSSRLEATGGIGERRSSCPYKGTVTQFSPNCYMSNRSSANVCSQNQDSFRLRHALFTVLWLRLRMCLFLDSVLFSSSRSEVGFDPLH